MVQAIIMAIELYLIFLFVRFIYRWILYLRRLSALKKQFKQLSKQGIAVTYKRTIREIVFAKKGAVDLVLAKDGKQYGVALLTHRLSMGRWNIEKTRRHYYFEIYMPTVFYRLNNSSENIPDHVKDFGREQQARRELMEFAPSVQGYDKLFLLVYPLPHYLTYTETRYTHLHSGDKIGEFEIISADRLPHLFDYPLKTRPKWAPFFALFTAHSQQFIQSML